ncbi:hypothetical protein [Streptomyces sp. NPDC049970]|uniref:SCO2400 family protein n=1 Tax=Streptomyces sp. NPDC049970 TaxID=3155033 RepID=UPI00341A4383
MDYCHPCRRHLNGALACAGCGTPADALVPYAAPEYPAHDAGPEDAAAGTAGVSGHRRRARETASRRRGRRGHRRRGRTLLLTATGVVLAVGALSLAELAIEPGGDSGASDYVSEATTAAEPPPSASAGEADDEPGPVDTPTVVRVTDSHSAGATDGPSGSTAPGVPRASVSADAPGDPRPSSSSAEPDGPADPGGTVAPAEPSGSTEPPAEPTQPEPSGDPEPAPSPSATCTPWLWWCV